MTLRVAEPDSDRGTVPRRSKDMATYRVTEVVHYEVEAEDPAEAVDIIINADNPDRNYFTEVSDRYATLEAG
jgi:hypothetical protein